MKTMSDSLHRPHLQQVSTRDLLENIHEVVVEFRDGLKRAEANCDRNELLSMTDAHCDDLRAERDQERERRIEIERKLDINPKNLAMAFHGVYKGLAPGHGYLSRFAKIPFNQLPANHQDLMQETCKIVLAKMRAGKIP